MGSQQSTIDIKETSSITEKIEIKDDNENKNNNQNNEKISFSNRFIKYTYKDGIASWQFNSIFVSNLNEKKNLEFWLWHPLGRGITTGTIQIFLANGFLNGFSFGALSGIINTVMYPGFHLVKREINNTVPSSDSRDIAHVINYSISVITPWACSYYLMKRYLPNSLPRPVSAVFLSAMTLFVGYANRDLLE